MVVQMTLYTVFIITVVSTFVIETEGILSKCLVLVLDYIGEFSVSLSKVHELVRGQEAHDSQLHVLSWDRFSVLMLALYFRKALLIPCVYVFIPRKGINTS